MKEVAVFDKVSEFKPSNLGLYIWMDGKVFLDNALIYENNPNAVYFYEGVFFIVESNWKDSIYFNSTSCFRKELIGIGGMDCFIDKQSILQNIWNEDYTVSKRIKIDIESGSVIWESQIGQVYIINEYFFGVLETNLCRVNPNSGQPIWQLNLLERYGTYSMNNNELPIGVQKYIGLYNDCLFIKAGNKLILGIDIDSGEERFHYVYSGNNVLLDNLCLDDKNGLIFSIGRKDYFELNLSSGEVEIVSIEKTVLEKDIETTRLGSWEDNIIYFWEGGSQSRFGLFDREAKTIIHIQDIGVSGFPAIRDVKHWEDKVYVLGGNNTLHVYQNAIYPA